jgi:hypothetical protein
LVFGVQDYIKATKYDAFNPDVLNWLAEKTGETLPEDVNFGDWVTLCPEIPDTCVSEDIPEGSMQKGVSLEYALQLTNWHQIPKRDVPLELYWCGFDGKENLVAEVDFEESTSMQTRRGHKFLIYVPAGHLGTERKLVGVVDPGFSMRWRGWDKTPPEPYDYKLSGCESFTDTLPEEKDPDDPADGEL